MTISVQITIIGLGILLLAAVILAAIQKKISESHALLWIVPCILIILGGIFPQMTYLRLLFSRQNIHRLSFLLLRSSSYI